MTTDVVMVRDFLMEADQDDGKNVLDGTALRWRT
jgi:hypothetical protein